MNEIAFKKIGMAAAGFLSLSLTACAGFVARETAEAEAPSALAPQIQQLVDANRRYPRWEDFPKAPTGLPTGAEVAAQVASLDTASAQLARQRVAIPWTLNDPAAFAETVRNQVEASRPAPSTLETEADVEAFAQRLRDRAAAPPPVDRFSRPPR